LRFWAEPVLWCCRRITAKACRAHCLRLPRQRGRLSPPTLKAAARSAGTTSTVCSFRFVMPRHWQKQFFDCSMNRNYARGGGGKAAKPRGRNSRKSSSFESRSIFMGKSLDPPIQDSIDRDRASADPHFVELQAVVNQHRSIACR